MFRIHGITLIVSLTCYSATALSQQASLHKYEPKELHQHFKNVAGGYNIAVDGKKTDLQEQPLLHWQNTVRQQEQGALYLWKVNNRPAVLGSIFTYGQGDATFCRHEMISLSDQSLSAELNGQEIWAPAKAGIDWKPLGGVREPAVASGRRMFQMRSAARQFSGMVYDPDLGDNRLVLIPQPVTRYQAPTEGVIDGAIFSLAVATDPEIFLVIEAVSNDGKNAWRFGAVRAHYNRVVLKRDDKVVWEAKAARELMMTQAGEKPWMNQPYFTFFEAEALPNPEELR